MKHLTAFLLALLLFVAPAFSASWTSVAEKVLRSTVSLQLRDDATRNFCSGIVINSTKDYVLTADHCVMAALEAGIPFTVDGKMATVILRDVPEDLAVVRVEDLNRTALNPSKMKLLKGTTVMAAGYAYGFLEAQVRISNLVYSSIQYPGGWCPSECIGVAIDHIGGMSGGPVVDKNGDLIGIVQFGDYKTGFGRSIKVIMQHVGKYFQVRG